MHQKLHEFRHVEWRLLEFVYGLLLATADTKPIERKIYDQSEIALRLLSSRNRATKS